MSQIQENLGDLFFALCVNFLLYCALIIVFYMLITFYLEEETSHTEQGYTKISTNEDGQEYKDDEDDEEDDVEDDEDDNENEKKISDKESESGLELVERKKPIKLIPPLIDLQTPSHDSPYTIVSGRKFLSSSSSSSSELPSSSQGVAVDSTTSSVNVASVVTSIGTSDSDSPAPVTTSSAADSSTTATTSTSTTQPSSQRTVQTMIKKVLFYAIGLTTTFSIWGIVQERMLTQPYDGVYFKYSYGLIFLNRLGGLLLSLSLMSYFRVTWVYSPLWEYSFPSVANMLSSWCQYEALKYVSFPTQTLSKAFKVVPVMLMGRFLYNKEYEWHEYVAAGTIGFGMILFIKSSENIDFYNNVFAEHNDIQGALCGVVLLILFLFFDSFTGQFQTRMFKINSNMSPLQMMLIMNAFSAMFSFVTLIHQEELYVSLQFVYDHTAIIPHLLLFCVCSTVGQLFIFYTVKNFGPVVFSIIMSFRILFSTLLSCLVYSHPVTEMGVIGILIVFGAVSYRIQKQLELNPPTFLLKVLEEYKHPKIEVFHEWHEHLDI